MWKRLQTVTPTSWRSAGVRPRVLIEHHDPAISNAVGNLLVDAGFDVATCDGPNERRQCPLVEEHACSRVEEADLVVYGLELSDEDDRDILQKLKTHAGGRPIVVEATSRRAALYAEELEGCAVVLRPMNRSTLLDAVEQALA